MSRPTNDMSIYYFYNIADAVAQECIKGFGMPFKELKELVNTYGSMFEYDNLPEGLTSRILELALTFSGTLCFWSSKMLGKVVLCKWLPAGQFDMYMQPTKVNLIALNGDPIANGINFKDIVLVRDNNLDIIPFIALSEHIAEMNNVEFTIRKQIELLKLPAIWKGDKQTLDNYKKIVTDALGFKPLTAVDKSIGDNNTFDQFDVKFTHGPEELLEVYKNYRNFTLEGMGIYGISSQKRERLLQSEVQSQNDYVDMMYQMRLNQRKLFIEECNKKFGTSIRLREVWKEYREDEIDIEVQEEKLITEVDDNATVGQE